MKKPIITVSTHAVDQLFSRCCAASIPRHMMTQYIEEACRDEYSAWIKLNPVDRKRVYPPMREEHDFVATIEPTQTNGLSKPAFAVVKKDVYTKGGFVVVTVLDLRTYAIRLEEGKAKAPLCYSMAAHLKHSTKTDDIEDDLGLMEEPVVSHNVHNNGSNPAQPVITKETR